MHHGKFKPTDVGRLWPWELVERLWLHENGQVISSQIKCTLPSTFTATYLIGDDYIFIYYIDSYFIYTHMSLSIKNRKGENPHYQ